MSEMHSHPTIVAGIDGSEAAIRAAQWAADEALSRSVPLRLVYVTKATHPTADDYYADVHHGRASLERAHAVLESAGNAVKIETAIVDGPPSVALVEESENALLVCVGSVGIGRYAQAVLGSTATGLAEKAHCPVAIIRMRDDAERMGANWIVFSVHDEPDDAVTEQTVAEARLRHAPVLALGDKGNRDSFDGQIEQLKIQYPDLRIYPIANEADVGRFLSRHDEPVQLAVIGSSEVGKLAQILGPYGHPIFHHAASSVLVMRD